MGRDSLAARMGAAWWSSACLPVHRRVDQHLLLSLKQEKTSILGTFMPPSSFPVAGQCFLQLLERGVGCQTARSRTLWFFKRQ